MVWEWVKSLLTDPEVLEQGLSEYQEQQSKANKPILERLEVLDRLLAENQAQLKRLLDLYVSGEFPREMLIERKSRLEATISALEKERAKLVSRLETQVLTEDQIRTIQELAAGVADGLDAMGDDFEARRRIIEILDVQATLTMEDEQKVVHAWCVLGERVSALCPVSQMNWLISDSIMGGPQSQNSSSHPHGVSGPRQQPGSP